MSAASLLTASSAAALALLGLAWADQTWMRARARRRLANPIPTAGSVDSRRVTRSLRRLPRWRRRTADPADVLAEHLATIAREVRAGATLAAAIAATPITDPDWALARATLVTVAAHGGQVAEPLDRTAGILRDRAALRDERRSQAAAAVLSARMLTLLPLVVGAWSITTSPSVRTVVLTSPIGWACLAGGIALNLTGRAWTRRIIGRRT